MTFFEDIARMKHTLRNNDLKIMSHFRLCFCLKIEIENFARVC